MRFHVEVIKKITYINNTSLVSCLQVVKYSGLIKTIGFVKNDFPLKDFSLSKCKFVKKIVNRLYRWKLDIKEGNEKVAWHLIQVGVSKKSTYINNTSLVSCLQVVKYSGLIKIL